jgi:hypothetical protein
MSTCRHRRCTAAAHVTARQARDASEKKFCCVSSCIESVGTLCYLFRLIYGFLTFYSGVPPPSQTFQKKLGITQTPTSKWVGLREPSCQWSKLPGMTEQVHYLPLLCFQLWELWSHNQLHVQHQLLRSRWQCIHPLRWLYSAAIRAQLVEHMATAALPAPWSQCPIAASISSALACNKQTGRWSSACTHFWSHWIAATATAPQMYTPSPSTSLSQSLKPSGRGCSCC